MTCRPKSDGYDGGGGQNLFRKVCRQGKRQEKSHPRKPQSGKKQEVKNFGRKNPPKKHGQRREVMVGEPGYHDSGRFEHSIVLVGAKRPKQGNALS